MKTLNYYSKTMANVKFLRTNKWTNGQTGRQKIICPRSIDAGVLKKTRLKILHAFTKVGGGGNLDVSLQCVIPNMTSPINGCITPISVGV